MKNKALYLSIAAIAFIFGQSLFFKFSGSQETVIIFSTIADWARDIGMPASFADLFQQYGGVMIASAELLAIVMLFLPRFRQLGALLSLGVISGAIFFHLFTPLGVDRVVDQQGNTDGGALFIMACVVFVSSIATLVLNRRSNSSNEASTKMIAEVA